MSSTKPSPIPDDPLRAFLRPRSAAQTPPQEESAPAGRTTVERPAPPPIAPNASTTSGRDIRVEDEIQPAGPLGGRSTVTTAGKLRKTVYFTQDQWSSLQRRAREARTSYSDIIAQALSEYLR